MKSFLAILGLVVLLSLGLFAAKETGFFSSSTEIVTLFDCSGNSIHKWETRRAHYGSSGMVYFEDLISGKSITISGTITVEPQINN